MSRYSAAYLSFVDRLEEVHVLRRMAGKLEGKKGITDSDAKKIRAICRGATVLLSSHIEGYMQELNEIIFEQIINQTVQKSRFPPKFRYYLSKPVFDNIRQTTDPAANAKQALELMNNHYEIWREDTPFQQSLDHQVFLKKFPAPRTDEIYKIFNRYGVEDVKSSIKKKLGSEYILLKNDLDNVVDVRNKIAHGDNEMERTPRDLYLASVSIRRFLSVLDNVVCTKFGRKNCHIRVCMIPDNNAVSIQTS